MEAPMTTRSKTIKPVYGLLINTKESTDYRDRATLDITLNVVKLVDGKLRNPSTSDQDALADFKVKAYVYEQYRDDLINTHAAFYDSYIIEARDAKRISKVFATLEKKTQALRDQLGRPQSFGAEVARIATALDIKHIIKQVENWGTNYDEGRYNFYSIGDGVNVLDRVVYDWRQAHPLPVEETEVAS
jgi:hypothetical protein